MNLEIERRNLIEELGVHMERKNLPPLAARIMATLILSGKKGVTFDELVNDLHAGKSSISTHLDHLQQTARVEYFTKPGDRKRYFITNPDLLTNVIDEMVEKWEHEKRIHANIKDYKQKCNAVAKEDHGFCFDLEFQENYLTFLEEIIASVKKFKTKISEKNNKH